MEEDWGEDDDTEGLGEFVSGETLQFISENRSVWIRMASVIQVICIHLHICIYMYIYIYICMYT